MKYYTSGPDAYPLAIIGIDRSWVLELDLWKKIDFTPERMKDIVQSMQSKALEHHISAHGFDILDHQGNKIGNWFSILGIDKVVKITGNNRIALSTPPLDTYSMT